MRRLLAALGMLFVLLPASASAYVGAPITHGTDPASVGAGAIARAPGALAKRQPTSWCGPERSTDDTASELPNGGYKEHAVYMVPSDGANRFGQVAASIQSDAFAASALLESTYGRAIRFDLGTACGPEYLDITVVRMPAPPAQLTSPAKRAPGTFDRPAQPPDAAGLPTIQPSDSYTAAAQPPRNWVVGPNAPAPAGTCGQA